MVFIISSDYDESTNKVIKWIYRNGSKVVRTGLFNTVIDVRITNIQGQFDVTLGLSSGEEVKLNDIDSYWYRKSFISLFQEMDLTLSPKYDLVVKEYRDYLKNEELLSLEQFIVSFLETKINVGNYNAKNSNKLIDFSIASDVGFTVPNLFISNTLDELKEQYNSGRKIIKPLQDLFYSVKDKSMIKNYYSDNLEVEELEGFSDKVFPSMVQDYIEKKMEIRTFYLDEETYSMAIFSQLDKKTKIDFRNYRDESPNRMVPFKLPLKIEQKVVSFMKRRNLNTGSLDFILTNDLDYVFLEVNPTGQYGMIEENCHYGLDQKIANLLSKN